MKGLTHIAGGAAAGIAYATAANLSITETTAVTACAMIAALIPDIDICTSKVGRLIAPASFAIQLLIGHRTIFHAPVLYLALFGFLSFRFPAQYLLLTAGAIGIASHLLLDMLNPAGIPLLWPLSKRFKLASVRSGGVTDWLLGAMIIAFIILFVILK